MPNYNIVISKTAQKQLDKLPDPVAEILIKLIFQLASNPKPIGYKKLKGRSGYRIRKGDYRIIYDLRENILKIDIVSVGHRKNIYD